MSQEVMEKSHRLPSREKEKDIFPILSGSAGCCSGSDETRAKSPDPGQRFVAGSVATPAGRVPRVTSGLEWRDHWGSIRARWGIGRMDYSIDPGLYALGTPDRESPVLVSANY